MSKIEWTDQTWNPIVGCSKISAGCENCYAEKMAGRLATMGNIDYMRVTLQKDGTGIIKHYKPAVYLPKWNGRTVFVKSGIDKPLKRKKPTVYFVCSMGDIFHESVPFEWIDKVMAVVWQSLQHKFIILTKRAERMNQYFTDGETLSKIHKLLPADSHGSFDPEMYWPLDNLILGVTVENQEMMDLRVGYLLELARMGWTTMVSVEPMLENIDLYHYGVQLDWVIVGCESGHNRRPCKTEWVESVVSQCQSGDVPVFVKQLNIGGKVVKDIEQFPKGLQRRQYPKILTETESEE